MSHSLISYTPKQNIKKNFRSPPLIAALPISFAFPKYFNVLECCCYSVTKCCLTLCNPMDCSMPGFPVHHQLPELAQTCVHRVGDTLNHLILFPFSSCFQSFPASGSFPVNQFFASGGQSIGASTSASVLPMTIQD